MEVLVEQVNLEDAKEVITPVIDEPAADQDVDCEMQQLREPERATRFRSLAARTNFIACDRADGHFAITELCREMSSPREGSWIALKHVVRYFKSRPWAVLQIGWQEDVSVIDIYADTNWAQCRPSRKSASGGCIRY